MVLNDYILPNLLTKSLLDDAISFLNSRELLSFPVPKELPYSGVYALYYFGDFDAYSDLSNYNKSVSSITQYYPIYVGKAVPRGSRTGQARSSNTLYHRLNEHMKSIAKAKNLNTDDFKCRFVIMTGYDEELIPALESELIRRYTPLWNSVIPGFGIHHPGSGRYGQSRSEWDTLHPGRPFADKLTGELIEEGIIREKIYLDSVKFR